MANKRKLPTDPLELSIYRREHAIDRMRNNIKAMRAETEVRVAEVEKRVQEKLVLLDALKRGRLK